jgi:hypothetical protein
MTEAEWLACNDPRPMLHFVKSRVSNRKLRLFDIACCRRIWALLADSRQRDVFAVAERYADDLVN